MTGRGTAELQWDWAGVSLHEASDLLADFETRPLDALMAQACAIRDRAFGCNITYSRKVFIPLTRLCRDVCRYCTFATTPRRAGAAYLSPDEVLAIARAGAGGRLQGGAVHARRQAGAALRRRARGAGRTRLRQHGRLSRRHVRAGAARDRPAAACQCRRHDGEEIAALRRVSVSQGMMLESGFAAPVRARRRRISARRTSTRRCGWR